MRKILTTGLIVTLLFLLNCTTEKDAVNRYNYPDVLNVKNVPDSTNDWSAFFFADRGAWVGFALPDRPDYFGSFIGPFSMRTQKWLAKDLIRFSIYNESNVKINFSECKSHKITYYPGILKQSYDFGGFEVELSLFYISHSEALITAVIKNNSDSVMKLSTGWEGRLFDENSYLKNHGDHLTINDPKDDYFGRLSTNNDCDITQRANQFIIKEKNNTEIHPNQSFEKNLTFRYSDNPDTILLSSTNPRDHYEKNQARWNGYLADIFAPNTKWLQQEKYKRVAVKALQTLVLNWRSAADDLHHDGLFPSSSVWYFNGFWAWDSWKHAVALSKFAPELAKDQVRTMFDYQNEKGMVADCIYLDKQENNWRNTKPPLAAWAVWKIYQETNDSDFVNEMFPQLLKYHEWWYQFRDHDNDGLCEYGSTDGTVIAAKWESGMDNAVRFDHSKILQNNNNEWSLDQESVDLNAYLYAEKLFLAKMADLFNKNDMAHKMRTQAEDIKRYIRELMFDDKSGFFYDVDIVTENFIKTKGPEGWTPLFTGLASEQQAQQVVETMCDTSEFATYIPFPTVSKKSPKFSTGYWRGTVWLDQACFGVMALREYGYDKEADKFTGHLLDRPEGLVNDDMPIRENYWSLDGKGMRVNHFSWSAAHILMLLWEEEFR